LFRACDMLTMSAQSRPWCYAETLRLCVLLLCSTAGTRGVEMGCTITSAALGKQLGASMAMTPSFTVDVLPDVASGEVTLKLESVPAESTFSFNSLLMSVTVVGTADGAESVGSFTGGFSSDYRTKACDPNFLDGVASQCLLRPADSRE
jgi:hypothetical protein